MKPRFIVAMPFVHDEYGRESLATNKMGQYGRLMPINNTTINRGIMRSHNMILDLREPDEWFIIMSAALRFGEPGGMDFIEHLHTHADHGVISAKDTFGWHLVAFSPEVASKMGRFDEWFSPYGWDDIDLSIRIHKLMPDAIWGAHPIDVVDMGMSHSLKLGGVTAPTTHRDYLIHKWDWSPGLDFDQYLDHPFGNPDNHVNFWPTRNDAHWDQPCPGWWRS